jgi:3-hydroxyisobutyrate dehydrogenase-like beta-hydroxyacid dehydrogenase
MKIFLLVLSLWVINTIFQVKSSEASPGDAQIISKNGSVSLIGLGGMGKAIAKCLMRHGYSVHGWNRTPLNNSQSWEEHHQRFTMYQTPTQAIMASNITIFVINSTPRLQTVKDILFEEYETGELSSQKLRGKILVNMVNHDPYAAHNLDALLESAESHHVAALLFGVPETVCSPASHLLISAAPRTTQTLQEGDNCVHILEHLGQLHNFSRGDVGLASVVYLSLVQSLYFGLAGYELSLLILQKYLASTTSMTPDTSMVVLKQYQQLASTLLSTVIPTFLPIISSNIVQQQWSKSYVPAAAVIDMFEMHDIVFKRLHLLSDSFHSTYTKYLRETVNAAKLEGMDGSTVGVSAIVQRYSTDNFAITETIGDDSHMEMEL